MRTMLLSAGSAGADAWLFVGSYTTGGSKGIYAWRMDGDGKISPRGLVAELPNPTFLALHPGGRVLYAVSEVSEFQGKASGSVSAYAVDPWSGALGLLNTKPTHGAGPCHLGVAGDGSCLVVANYFGGSIAAFALGEDGTIGASGSVIQHEGSSVHPVRQKSPRPHGITFSPDGRFVLVCDLGLDRVSTYAVDGPTANLVPHSPAYAAVTPGAGSRHLVFQPEGRVACVINELNCTVTVFEWTAGRGALREIQTIHLLDAELKAGDSGGEIGFDPSGQFLYCSVRGHDRIVVFAYEARTGRLARVGAVASGGSRPRHFAVDPSGGYLVVANHRGNTLRMFHLGDDGIPVPTAWRGDLESPACAVFLSKPHDQPD